jgi:hypothetical protein
MSIDPTTNSPSGINIEALTKDIANKLLQSNSSVANESAFKKDREQYRVPIAKMGELRETIQKLQSVVSGIRIAEKAYQEAGTRLQVARKQLADIAAPLGAAAFLALQQREVVDHPRFTARKNLQNLIDSLQSRRAALAKRINSGVLEKAALKAQELTLLGQIKLEDMKIVGVNRELGELILSAKEEAALQCTSMTESLQSIQLRRAEISKTESEVEAAGLHYQESKQQAAFKVGIHNLSDAAAWDAQLQQKQNELRIHEESVEDLEEAVVEKALGYDWLEDDPDLRENLLLLKQLRKESTPKKLSAWPLAAVVVVGHLLAPFGGEPLNLSVTSIAMLYILTGLSGFALLAYYKPEVAEGERRFKSLILLFSYTFISLIAVLGLQSVAYYALENWSEMPDWARHRVGLILFVPRMILVIIGRAYRDTMTIMGGEEPESLFVFFKDHLLSIGLCEELIKLAPALIALTTLSGDWSARKEAFNAKLIYLAMIGGMAFGLGEAVYYHFTMYLPAQAGWGIYVTRFMTLVTIHAVWAGISGWILAHVTGGLIREAFSTFAQGLGPLFGTVLVALTILISDVLHTSHNLSIHPLWTLLWDVVSLLLFAWMVRCSNVVQLIPNQWKQFQKKGFRAFALSRSISNTETVGVANPSDCDPASQSVANAADEPGLPPIIPPAEKPQLWNPNAAGLWSILFTPIFGAWLHAKNWLELKKPEKHKKSMYWVWGSLATVILCLFLPRAATQSISLILLISWWLVAGQEQKKYVQRRFADYRKRSWGTPLSIAGLVFFAVFLVILSLGIDSALQDNIKSMSGDWRFQSQGRVRHEESGALIQTDSDSTTSFSENGQFTMSARRVIQISQDRGKPIVLVLDISSAGTWTFDGITLIQSNERFEIEPADVESREFIAVAPDFLEAYKNEYASQSPKVYENVIFLSENEIQFQEYGTTQTMKRVLPSNFGAN